MVESEIHDRLRQAQDTDAKGRIGQWFSDGLGKREIRRSLFFGEMGQGRGSGGFVIHVLSDDTLTLSLSP